MKQMLLGIFATSEDHSSPQSDSRPLHEFEQRCKDM
jgi:hypothetical protein